jgi:hypothetical protein
MVKTGLAVPSAGLLARSSEFIRAFLNLERLLNSRLLYRIPGSAFLNTKGRTVLRKVIDEEKHAGAKWPVSRPCVPKDAQVIPANAIGVRHQCCCVTRDRTLLSVMEYEGGRIISASGALDAAVSG